MRTRSGPRHIEEPAHGQTRASNELRKRGTFVSPSGVRGVWLRHNPASQHFEQFAEIVCRVVLYRFLKPDNYLVGRGEYLADNDKLSH